jgi:hypothetical protein
VWRDDTHYYFDLIGSNDRLTVDNWYSGSTYRIENVEFADGTVWNSAILNSKTTIASEYADFYWGTGPRHHDVWPATTASSASAATIPAGGTATTSSTAHRQRHHDRRNRGDTYVVGSATDTVTELAGGTDLNDRHLH